MRGDLLGVWEETFQEIWTPLAEQENVPIDVYSQLYRELSGALKDRSGDEALAATLADAIQLREAFDKAFSLAGVAIAREEAEVVFEASGASNLTDPDQRRKAAQACLAALIGNEIEAARLLTIALSEIAGDPKRRAEAKTRAVEGIVNDQEGSRSAFEATRSSDFSGERALVLFVESAFEVLDDLGGDALSNCYFNLLEGFVAKFSLRYDLRRPCTLCPTLPGVFASLVRDLRVLASRDAHLDSLMKEFENAVRDLRHDCSDGRIKTCIQKQVNLLEAIGRTCPGVTGTTLGVICNQLDSWPHARLKDAMKNLYGFASDYPGIRHAGTPANALRMVDMRDLVAMSILLVGFTPYLSDALNSDAVYRGA